MKIHIIDGIKYIKLQDLKDYKKNLRYKVELRTGCVVLLDTFKNEIVLRKKGRVVNKQWKVSKVDIEFINIKCDEYNKDQFQLNFEL